MPGKGHRLQDIPLHVVQTESIGLSRVEVNLPLPPGGIQPENLRTLLPPLRGDHPARIHPVAISGIEFALVGNQMHDFGPSGIRPGAVKIPRIVTLPPCRGLSPCLQDEKPAKGGRDSDQ